MSTDTQELLRICEQLPEAKRAEVVDFARFLLKRDQERPSSGDATDRWLAGAEGAANSGLTTDQILSLTRGES
jgi:hypothetical protein